MLVDCHNHLQNPRFDQHRDGLISEMRKVGIHQCVVNGTTESDWPKVKGLAQDHPDLIIPSYGLHPWYLDQRSDHWLNTLVGLLKESPTAAIGECGLDRWIKDHDIDLQLPIFKKHLDLAVHFDRPITIHCLKAWGNLLTILKESTVLPTRLLLHSYSGSLETARELLKLGAHFSFSGHFLHSRKAKVREIFHQFPPDRILVETDAPDMSPPSPNYQLEDLNHPANLPDIVAQCSQVLDIPVEQFAQNSRNFFNIIPSQK